MTENGKAVYNETLVMLDRAAHYTGESVATILRPERTQFHARLRWGPMWVLKRKLGLSFPRLARDFGKDNHTTIIHGVKKAEHLRETCPDFRAYTDYLSSTVEPREAA